MDSNKIRWGILSTAKIGRKAVIPAIQASSNGIVSAIASRNKKTAKKTANEFGIEKSFGSYEELLADENIDAIYIPLPNSMHHEWTIKAAKAGKHILCEKPLAVDPQQCLDMHRIANENNVKLMEAFMYRFHPRTQKVLDIIQSGKIGKLKYIHASFSFNLTNYQNIRYQADLAGGALMDVGCYCVNIARTLANNEPISVQAIANWASTGVDEYLYGTLQFPNDIVAHIDCSLDLPRRQQYQAVCTEGTISVPQAYLPGIEKAAIVETSEKNPEITHWIEGIDEYQVMVEHFAKCILENLPVRYPATEAAENMRVIQALYNSAKNNGIPEIIKMD